MFSFSSPWSQLPSNHHCSLATAYKAVGLMIVMLCINCANGQIYSWTDEQGNTVYSDEKPLHGTKTIATPKITNSYSAEAAFKNISSKTIAPKTIAPKTIKLSPDESFDGAFSNITSTNNANSDNSEPSWNEEKCQEVYAQGCEKVFNWKKYAIQSCDNDRRCDDDKYLERKYKPVPIKQLQLIARRAAIRKNRQGEEISKFLRQKYTGYCENHAALTCNNDNNCNQTILEACKDPRSLEDIFYQYNRLTPEDKINIIAQARALSNSDGANRPFYNKKLTDLLSLLVTRTLLGF